MNNPWRKFSDEKPKSNTSIQIKMEGIIPDTFYIYKEEYDAVKPDDCAYYSSFGFNLGNNLEHEWRYDQDGWLYPEEVTGNEDADYWLVQYKEKNDSEVRVMKEDDFGWHAPGDQIGTLLTMIEECPWYIAFKPMKCQQPPEWMI